MDPSSLCSQGVTQSEAGHGNGGLNQGGSGLPLECSGIDQGWPSLGSQLQQPFVEATNQFQLLSPQQPLPPQIQHFSHHQQGLWLLPLPPPQLQLQQMQLLLQVPLLLQRLRLLLPLPLLRLQRPLLQRLPPQQRLQQLLQELRLLQPLQPLLQELERLLQELERLQELGLLELLRLQERLRELELQLLQELGLQPLQLRGESSFDDINGIESLKVTSKCEEKLSSNTSSLVDNDFDHSDEIGSDEINLIGSQTSKVRSKRKKKCKSSVWKSYRRITEKDGKERAQCIRCSKKYLIDSKTIGTSTLNRHEKKCSRNETRDVGQLEPRDQGPEPIQEENIIEARTPERPGVPQAHISPAVQWWTLSSPASGVLGTTPAVTTKRRRFAEMHTESDKSIWSEKSAFGPTSHDSANNSAGTQADEGKSSTPPAATEQEVQAPRDLQLSLATTKSGPQEESGSVHKQFASAEELRSIAERKKALKITLNCILDSIWKGQIPEIECLGLSESAVDVVLSTVGSAVDVKPLEAIFTELFASLKEWKSIQDPASLYQNEVLDPVAKLEQELHEESELYYKERSSWNDRREELHLYKQESQKHQDIILSSLHELEVLDRTTLRRELDEERELENKEHSSWIDRCRRQMLLDMDKSLEHKNILLTEALERPNGIDARIASKCDRLDDFLSMVKGILGVELDRADPEVAAQRYAAHKREAIKAQLLDFSGKINDFFKE